MVKHAPQSDGSLRTEVLRRRYLRKDEEGHVVETWEDLCHRVAQALAAAEAKYGADAAQIQTIQEAFFQRMVGGEFLPNSPTLMNAGRKNGLLSACFVVSVDDSIEDIFEAVRITALIQRAGGGTGFSFGKLRPTGDRVASSGGVTSGPISFMVVFATVTGAIQQGALRRGANMGLLPIDHPDILGFITAKQDPRALTNFNLSVAVTDEFMKRLKTQPDSPHVVINPRTKKSYFIPESVNPNSYTIDDLVPEDGSADGCYTARYLWNMLVESAWASGEPGICFIDRVNQYNPTPQIGPIEACNPCGEQPLLAYEACNLGSIDVSKFVATDGTDIHWDRLAEVVDVAIRLLDDVIEVNCYPVPQIEQVTRANRKVGLGVMGFADTLILLGIRYDSEEAVAFAEKLATFIQQHAHQASENLADQRGCFPNWAGSVWNTEYDRPMRNATVTTIAPTGTISLIAGCSSGIEPVFSIVSRRRALDGREFTQLHPLVERLGIDQGWLTEQVRTSLATGIPPGDIPPPLSNVLVTAHEISPQWHVRIQAAFQKQVDNAVSKTVNLRADTMVDEVDRVYLQAFELGCKGITVYRDGSRENQVLTFPHAVNPNAGTVASPRPRPTKTEGSTLKKRTGCGSLYVTINRDEEGLFEIFTNLGKAGGCPSQSEATARVLSVALRSGVSPEVLIEQLKGIRCLSTISRRKSGQDIDVLSCPDAIAQALEEALGCGRAPSAASEANACPDCGSPLHKESGCNVCDNCGYSKCG